MWRLVEAQHHYSTLKFVDDVDEQRILEGVIEETKPPIPDDCADLDFLLMTPFRYRGNPFPSRFRRAGQFEGVLYASEDVATAAAEQAFWRLLFWAESPEMPWPAQPLEFTAFAFEVDATALDLTRSAFDGVRSAIEDPTDYAACQALADAARAAGIQAIRYRSVRDPEHGANLALLTPKAISKGICDRRTWRIFPRASGVDVVCEFPYSAQTLGRTTFADDPRIAAMRWER